MCFFDLSVRIALFYKVVVRVRSRTKKTLARLSGIFLLFFLAVGFKTNTFLATGDDSVSVATPDEFILAWNNPMVRKIELKADINTKSAKETLIPRTETIEVSGNKGNGQVDDYYQLYLYATKSSLLGWKNGELKMGYPENKEKKKMNFNHLIMENNGGLIGESSAIISDEGWLPGSGETAGQYWELNFNNITVPKGDTTRLARATRAQINLSGKVNLSTQSENFYTGGIHIAEGTDYYGEITSSDFSIIWFRASRQDGDAGTGDFVVEPNSKVKLRNTGNGATYPAIYRNWQTIKIGQNSEFIVMVPGNAIGFGGGNKKFIAEQGSKVALKSLGNHSAISTSSLRHDSLTGIAGDLGDFGSTTGKDRPMYSENSEFRMEPGSSLYVYGESGWDGMIYWQKGKNNKFIIDKPQQFDIKNNQDYPALTMANSNQFTIKDSNIDMWKQGSNVEKNSDFSYNQVTDMSFINKNSEKYLNISSDNKKLETEVNKFVDNSKNIIHYGYFKRLSGIDKEPLLEWERYATDAEKKFNKIARVRTGSFPTGGLDGRGNMKFVKSYAKKDEVAVKVTDPNGSYLEQPIKTDAEGYISFESKATYQAGQTIKVVPSMDGIVGSEQSLPPVVDVTPPEPVTLDKPLTTSSKKIKGKSKEPNSSLYMKKNNASLKKVGAVKPDGNWELELTDYLEDTDIVTIYSEDQAGKIPSEIEDSYLTSKQAGIMYNIPLGHNFPMTNNEKGNINPDKELSYIDTTFKAAPQFKVTNDLAKVPSIKKSVKSNTVDEKGKENTEVGSYLTYTVMIKNEEAKNSGKRIKNTKFSDDIWTNKRVTLDTGEVQDNTVLNFDLAKSNWHIKKNGTIIDSSKSEGSEHLLSYKEIEDQEGKDKTYKRLEANIGDLEAADEIEISYEVTVNRGAVGEEVTNVATVSGEDARKNPLKNKAYTVNPGGVVKGELALVSIPVDMNFGSDVKIQDFSKMVNVTKEDFDSDKGLTIEDTRAVQKKWKLSAKVNKEMTFQNDGTKPFDDKKEYQLKDGFSYVYNGNHFPLSVEETKVVFDSSNPNNKIKPDAGNVYRLSDCWGETYKVSSLLTEGLKFQSNTIPNEGTYHGIIEWQVQDTIQ